MLKLLIFCLIACIVEECQGQCNVLEGTTSIRWSCIFSPTGNVANFSELLWSTAGLNSTVISRCSPNGPCTNNYSSYFVATIAGSTSTLTFANASRTLSFNFDSLRCQWLPLTSFTTICSNLYIGIKPQNISCEVTTVNETRKLLNCTIARAYPSAECTLQISNNNISYGTLYNIYANYTQTIRNETPVYYSQTCQVLVGDRAITMGTNYVKALAYPKNFPVAYGVPSEAILLNTVFAPDTSDQNTTNETDVTKTLTSSTSDTALVIGLAISTAIFGIATVVLAVVLACYCLRNKKKERTRKPEKPSAAIPEGYNNVSASRQGEDNYHFYEEVNRRKVSSAGENQKVLDYDEPTAYANS